MTITDCESEAAARNNVGAVFCLCVRFQTLAFVDGAEPFVLGVAVLPLV